MIIFISNLPAFYKVRLWNELAQREEVLAIFTGRTLKERNADFFNADARFKAELLQGNIFKRFLKLYRLLRSCNYRKLIFGGWDDIPSILCAFLFKKKKNGCIIESTVFESSASGVKGFIKKIFLKRMSTVYVPGQSNKMLVESFGYKGTVVVSGGCGLLNYQKQPPFEQRKKVRRFLYVGRLVEVKNLEMLVEMFNELPQYELAIIGFGPLEDKLKSIAKGNVKLLGAVNNSELPRFYKEFDVFILPSMSETWGLVVEEALNNGTPVIVSDRVGCKDDLVTPDTGLVFKWNDKESMKEAIMKISEHTFYNKLRLGVSNLDFDMRAKQQIDTFLT